MGSINYDAVKAALDDAKMGASQFYDTLRSKNLLKNSNAEEILAALKLHEIVNEKKEEKKENSLLVTILAIIGIVALIVGVAYAVYCYLTPDYLDAYDDDFDEDELDDDFFEDEEDY